MVWARIATTPPVLGLGRVECACASAPCGHRSGRHRRASAAGHWRISLEQVLMGRSSCSAPLRPCPRAGRKIAGLASTSSHEQIAAGVADLAFHIPFSWPPRFRVAETDGEAVIAFERTARLVDGPRRPCAQPPSIAGTLPPRGTEEVPPQALADAFRSLAAEACVDCCESRYFLRTNVQNSGSRPRRSRGAGVPD